MSSSSRTAATIPIAAIDGVCARAGGGCTLRAAIQEANADAVPDRDTIVVDDSITNIQLGSVTPFPAVLEPLILSGAIAAGRVDDRRQRRRRADDRRGRGRSRRRSLTSTSSTRSSTSSAPTCCCRTRTCPDASGAGVRFGAGSTGAVGGAAGHGNRIFGNGGDGVLLDGSTDVNVSHNRIGLDGANGGDGVSSSDAHGAGLRQHDLRQRRRRPAPARLRDAVTGNRIGTQADGTGAVPNADRRGRRRQPAARSAAGTGESNMIAANTGHGVLVTGAGGGRWRATGSARTAVTACAVTGSAQISGEPRSTPTAASESTSATTA